MEMLASQGLSTIPEEFRDSIEELEDERPFAGESLLAEHDPATPAVKKARRLLYRRFRVEVEDGRLFVGKFHCLDKQGNIILHDTTEFRHVLSSGGVGAAPLEKRILGMVLIPASLFYAQCYGGHQFGAAGQ